MPNLRNERVRELLKREIGEVLRREFPVNEAGLISVNEVDLSADMHSAVVYVSILGSAEQQNHGRNVINHHRKRIQTIVAHSIILKYTPVLRFVLDDSVVRGNRVLQILDELGPLPETDPVAEDSDPSEDPV
jgi:ribosome-binding factor A